ncbi:lysine-specific demethylase 7B-like isoform X1 [Coregonus clupeaformis]|uniref:lysine-specific demethylase 7B-like isoform X1 n=1 Tax=Coregonus clupeaformis TaxID=59861 RepID=UPI001E1C2BEE|nr:lysine-specific demethylase 7B-like isoform X1 [Coregonus clupeaformis]
MAAAPLYCVCRQSYDVSRFMIECDICKDWFHGSCVQVEEHHAVDIDVYHCPNCDVQHGPCLMKKRNNWHRHDYTEPDDGSRPVQAGTSVFVRELQNRPFPSAAEILVQMQGHQVTHKYLEKQGFSYPIAVPELVGLGLKLPPSSFSVRDVEEYVGGDKIVDVIDVARQADSKMKLREFVKYYYKPHRPKVLNVISLEFSDTKMAALVVVPDIAQKMSWVENYWPDDSFFPKPFVQKYCLMGVKNSYTDFHIDFGGTSVWYHVLWGEKIFYLIKPTQANLALYEAWSSSPNQSEVFFGDKVDQCYKCVVPQGTTVLIPTGWIHAVLTSQDCMAFGGNFLHNLNIGMQLRCYEMEWRLKTPDLFKFPYFEAICWYVAKNLLETLKELREDNCQPPAYLTDGVKALITALKNWLKREVTEPASEVPDHIRPNHLIKELTKEIRYLEEEEQSGGSKPIKSQGCGACLLTRSTLDKASHHARRTARRLRHHHHHHHAPKTPSNLEILELHTRQVLKRLEVGPFEEDVAFSSTVMAKFNKASMASAAAVERSPDNNLLLVMCNGRIIRDERRHTRLKSSLVQDGKRTGDHQREGVLVKTEINDSKQEQHRDQEREEKPSPLSSESNWSSHQLSINGLEFFERVNTELREGAAVYSDISDSESKERCSTQKKDSSGEDSGSSEEEDKEQCRTERGTGSVTDLHQASQAFRHFHKPLKRQRPTSPTTEEEAIEGMLSMAGLLYPQRPEESSTAQEPWWSRPAHQSPDSGGREPVSGEESQDSDSNSTLSLQDERRAQQHVRKECRAELSQRIQENKNFMDSQSSGSNSNSSEAWGDQSPSQAASSPLHLDPSSGTDYQYSETSLSPPRHPSKRPAPNTPPISNQATKGKRPKKGMTTAKQRLGKILKLSRNNHFLL